MDALGGPGVVLIPAGSFELDGTVTVTSDDVTILGAGATRTRLFRATDDPEPTVAAAPYLKAAGADRFRVAHLEIRGVSQAGSTADEKGVWISNGKDFRVDHTLLTFLGFAGVYTAGTSRGVVDHNQIHDGYKPAIANHGYGVCVMGTGAYTNLPYGTPEATFAEDNEVHAARHAAASNNAARYVFRYNHVTGNENSHGVDAHGDEYNNTNTGTEWIEVHHNTIEMPVYSGAAVRIRGGKGAIWANNVKDYANAVSLWHKTPQTTGPVYIWGNTLGSGVQTIGDIQGTVSYKLTSPAGYKPYTYPHPLVTDLEASAGPDMVVMAEPGSGGSVYLDASATKADKGSVKGFAWHDGAAPVMSTCAHDIVDLPVGDHVVLLEAVRSDGLTEFDTAFVRVEKAGPTNSATTWAGRWFVPVVGKATVSFTVSPKQAAQDGYIALTGRHAVAGHEDEAIVVRTNNAGHFDARDGGNYAALATVPYSAGASYDVVVSIDVAAQTYDVTVNGIELAKKYAFRRAESSIGQLSAWHSKGGLTVTQWVIEGDRATPDAACAKAQEMDGGVDGGAGGAGGAMGAGGARSAGASGMGGAGVGGAMAPSSSATDNADPWRGVPWSRRRDSVLHRSPSLRPWRRRGPCDADVAEPVGLGADR